MTKINLYGNIFNKSVKQYNKGTNNMFVSNELKKVVKPPHLNEVKQSFHENLMEIICDYIEDKAMFDIEDFTPHYLDEFELRTNCHEIIYTTMFLEIDQPNNYRPVLYKKRKKKKTGYQVPELYLPLKDIRQGIFDTCVQHFNSSQIIWMDKFSIYVKATIFYEKDDLQHDYYFRIVPSFTYYNENNVRGIVYYSGNDVQIEYPALLEKNFKKKNKQTKDMYRQLVLIFKNIILKDPQINDLPTEIIETLLYNVPNEMLLNDSKENIINIINFIRNNSLKDFKTIDEQDTAFGSIYRGMSAFYVKHILKIIEKYLATA